MKNAAFLVLLMTSVAFGREVTSELKITKGPYVVPVRNEAFNALGPDFESTGEILFYKTSKNLNLNFHE